MRRTLFFWTLPPRENGGSPPQFWSILKAKYFQLSVLSAVLDVSFHDFAFRAVELTTHVYEIKNKLVRLYHRSKDAGSRNLGHVGCVHGPWVGHRRLTG
jgi:hypothetical protein